MSPFETHSTRCFLGLFMESEMLWGWTKRSLGVREMPRLIFQPLNRDKTSHHLHIGGNQNALDLYCRALTGSLLCGKGSWNIRVPGGRDGHNVGSGENFLKYAKKKKRCQCNEVKKKGRNHHSRFMVLRHTPSPGLFAIALRLALFLQRALEVQGHPSARRFLITGLG